MVKYTRKNYRGGVDENVGNIKILNLVITIDLVPGVIQDVMVVNVQDV